MRILLFALVLFCSLASLAQNEETVSNLLNRVLPSFKFKQELKNCVLMPGGEFVSGRRNGADSITLGYPVKTKIQPFLISKFEVRNKDYRSFTVYVRDSILHTLLGHFITTGKPGRIDWAIKIDFKDPKVEPMILSPEERIMGRKEMDVTKIIYRTSSGQNIAIYPDTLVWIRDFAYSYNEPMTKRYFSHPSFNNYPVVGVSQVQALAYCDWLTQQWNADLQTLGEKNYHFLVKLPSSEEWEYAAQTTYSVSIKDSTQRLSCESQYGSTTTPDNGYKYNIGRYFDATGLEVKSYGNDGYFYTAPASSYKADKNGLYNMIGNVAEWTSTPGGYKPVYNAGRNEELVSLFKKFPNSPFIKMSEKEIDSYLKKYIITKGGAWHTDGDFYLQPGVNQYFSANDFATCYIGFRMAISIVRNGN
ncbi:MAG: SUMF1/EgtB/PvdO family nonheme iron enzyme [Chitinophagaceae bacterium]